MRCRFRGLPRDCLTWFKLGRGTKEQVQANCDIFRRRLSPVLYDLGCDLHERMSKPADARLEGWNPEKPIRYELQGWYVHLCDRRQLTANYPTHWWVALGREARRYVPLAQLTFGVSSEEGGSGFIGFLLDEVQQNNEDRGRFQRGAAKELGRFMQFAKLLPPDTRLSWWDDRKRAVQVCARDLTEAHVHEFAVNRSKSRLNFGMELYYPAVDGRMEPFFDGSIVDKSRPLVEALYPFYHLAVRGHFPKDMRWFKPAS